MSRSVLKKGSTKKDEVVYLQQRLNAHGFHVSVDGDFGNGTDAAVKQFQASNNLKADGIVGSGTWDALEGESTGKTSEKVLSADKQALLAKIPDGISENQRKVLEAAIKDLGADEIPDGSNWGAEIQHLVEGYNDYWKTGDKTHYPWCGMAQSTWIGVGLGLGTKSTDMDWTKHPFKGFFGGAAQIENWGKKNKKFVEGSQEAPAASCFTMARGGSGSDASKSTAAGHVGMVVCDNGNGTFTTIEGNVSNGVRSYVRKKKDVHGYVCWW